MTRHTLSPSPNPNSCRIVRPSLALVLVLSITIPLAASAQNRTGYIAPVRVSAGPSPACSGTSFAPAGAPPRSTFDSFQQELAAAAWQQSHQNYYRPAAGQIDQDYERPPRAVPNAPDQSDLLKNSKDPDFILRNFKTMYVETRNIEFFRADQMKAALLDNPDFRKLGIHIVDDPRVADTVLRVSYTFAWDYPFELRHQNSTTVLLGGKGYGPFSGPLGAADVARQFVNLAGPWRKTTAASNKEVAKPE